MNMNDLFEKYYTSRLTSKQAVKEVEKSIAIIFEECPGIHLIMVRGWTPGFNDGDPCTHSQCVLVENYGDCDFVDGAPQCREDLEEANEHSSIINDEVTEMLLRQDFRYDTPLPRWSSSYSEDMRKRADSDNRVKAYLILQGMKDIISTAYDTNFTLVFTCNPDTGVMNFRQEDYDCGW